MNTPGEPTNTKRQPPVGRYAAIIGALVIAALVIGAIVGQKGENPHPTAVSSPHAGASTGPSPRY